MKDMELYDSFIRETTDLLGTPTQKWAYKERDAWKDNGESELVLLRDAAYELGGGANDAVNFTCVTSDSSLVPADEVLLYGEVIRRADHLVDVPYRFGSQTFRLFLGLDAVNSAAVQQVLVEPLQVQRGQVCQRDAADLRLDVVFQKALRGFEGRWTEFHLGVVLHPDLQPTPHRVGLGPSVVDADVFLDGFFQFFFYFRLRLAEDVFDDGLASFRIVTDCVPALPSTVFPLANVPFPVRSSFRHGISPFRNEQYRNQGNKATRKSNCYQKVIICTSEPRRLIFDYCGAIFALPGASSLFIARQILNRLLCRLFVFISVKVKPFLAYTSSTCFLISGLMRKRNISVLGAVTMFSTSDSSSLDCFLGHGISDDIKKVNEM